MCLDTIKSKAEIYNHWRGYHFSEITLADYNLEQGAMRVQKESCIKRCFNFPCFHLLLGFAMGVYVTALFNDARTAYLDIC
jgi:hypothetical protein